MSLLCPFVTTAGVIAENGVVYHLEGSIATFDLETGEKIAGKGGPRGAKKSRHYALLCGDVLVGLDHDGFSTVARVSPDGKQIGEVHSNRLGTLEYGKGQPNPLDKVFNYGATHFASGNRIFIRSNTHLYCIGDPNKEMVLSPAHR